MYNFFIDPTQKTGDVCHIKGGDFNHVKNVLRMKIGEKLLISTDGLSALCQIEEFLKESVLCRVIEENYQDTALTIKITLFQGMPKADKMELIIQKAVELGTNKIVPVEMARSIVKLDGKKKQEKVSRWQAIAESAAKQSKRTSIPTIERVLSYEEAIKTFAEYDLILLPYECKNGMKDTRDALDKIKEGMSVAVIIGPEGGFDLSEVEKARDANAIPISLGKRILRTETAAITALAMLMLHAEINL